jgi:hypothetical protein
LDNRLNNIFKKEFNILKIIKDLNKQKNPILEKLLEIINKDIHKNKNLLKEDLILKLMEIMGQEKNSIDEILII